MNSRFSKYLPRIHIGKREFIQWLPLIIVLSAATVSFIYGWYFDSSKPHAGSGWIDQETYLGAAEYFASLKLPAAWQMHFSIGYSLLGAVGHWVLPLDPFAIVSYSILMASVTLCFLAVQRLLGTNWAVAFTALLLFWDGAARSLEFMSDLFAVPWNNQVMVLLFSFYLWLFSTQSSRRPSYRLIGALGLISGLTFLTREESILFIIPLSAIYLLITKAGWRKAVFLGAIISMCFLPQLIVKNHVLGSLTKSNRRYSYSQLPSQYLQPALLGRNFWETIVNSEHYKGVDPRREALFQAAPWLWLSPIGIGYIIFSKRYPLGLKIYIIASLGLIIFYLSGHNMSAHKLKYHCLRYIAPGFIALNLGVLIFIRETTRIIQEKFTKNRFNT